MTKTTEFDISQYLDDKEIIAEYLTQVLKDRDMEELLQAVGNITKAKGMRQVAKDTDLGRESLYKTFQVGAKPRFETVMKVLNSLGVKIQAST